jgi:copper homeostasis protein
MSEVAIGCLEVCANSYQSALAAQNGGAKRVEFCDNLAEGGTTPSYAQIALAKKYLSIEVWPIIRPRGGDFLYSEIEFELMKEDIKICRSLNCEGIVTGILKADGTIDKEMSNDMNQALEDLITLNIKRVLTSGGASSAILGAEKLAQLVKKANGRITIMPGAGINENNIKNLIDRTGATQFHASAKEFVPSKMEFRNTETKMGSIEDEYRYELTSEIKVKALVDCINKALN